MSTHNVPPLPQGEGGDEEPGGEAKRKQRVFMSPEVRKKLLNRPQGSESFNLDQYQLRQLNQILERVAIRKKHDKVYDPSLSRNQIRLLELEELIIGENKAYKEKRAENSNASSALKMAILGDEYQLRQIIHRQGTRVIDNRDIFNGRNPLHEAVASGHLHIVKMFLDEYRCNPNVITLLGSTSSLHIACEKGHRQVASTLITFGANINGKDIRGCTPLHVCSNKACVKLLLRYSDQLNPLLKTVEGLLPSEHYWKYTDDDEKITEIQTILQKAQEKKLQENARMARIRNTIMYEESLMGKGYKLNPHELKKRTQQLEKKKVVDSDSD